MFGWNVSSYFIDLYHENLYDSHVNLDKPIFNENLLKNLLGLYINLSYFPWNLFIWN